MTATFDPEIACHRKHRYGTEEAAHAIAADCFAARGTWLRVYACTTCSGFHLTSKNAEPPPTANWAPPAKSQRQIAADRRREEARGRRRRARGRR